MDLRTGKTYESLDEARRAGVPPEALVEIRAEDERAAKEAERLLSEAIMRERENTAPPWAIDATRERPR